MAIPQNTLIGKTSGSVGGTTFSSWKGKNILKSKAVSVANPNTPAQQTQRSALKKAVAVFRAIHDIVDLGFMQQAVGMSGYNAFTSENLRNGAFTGLTENAIDAIPSLKIAKGTLAPTAISTASQTVNQTGFIVTWANSITANQSPADKALVVIVDSTGSVIGISNGINPRAIGTVSVPQNSPGTQYPEFSVYLAFYQESTRQASDSTYLSIAD